jgi:hypothetical protein
MLDIIHGWYTGVISLLTFPKPLPSGIPGTKAFMELLGAVLFLHNLQPFPWLPLPPAPKGKTVLPLSSFREISPLPLRSQA